MISKSFPTAKKTVSQIKKQPIELDKAFTSYRYEGGLKHITQKSVIKKTT